jgi:hypothetical protein
MKTFLTVMVDLVLGVVLWVFIASLITHACNAWWQAREKYRKLMDKHVGDMLDEEMKKFN